MPIYQYECKICGARFERLVPVSKADEMQPCPSGHHDVTRVFSVPAVVFKGSGFYVTDHPKVSQEKPK